MPTRMLREGILSSERVNALSERAELFYRRLMSVVDDYGRFSANPTLLRSSCYPLKFDSVKEDSIKKHLAEAADAGLIVLYTVGGKPYLEIQDFGQRIQSKSKFPEPQGGSRDSTVENGASPGKTDVVGDVVEVEDVVEKPPRKRGTSRKTLMPDDFAVSDRVKAWAEEKGFGQLQKHLDHFRLTAQARAYTYADWDSAFMKAIADNWAKVAAPAASMPAGGGRRAL